MENQNLFVGNLDFDTTKEEISDLFSPFGTIKTISLRPKKGFAFVEMAKAQEAEAIIEKLDQTEFKTRALRISLRMPKKKAKAVTRARRVKKEIKT